MMEKGICQIEVPIVAVFAAQPYRDGTTSCLERCHRFPYTDFDLENFTVQSRLKIANSPNFDSTSCHCSAATARMKTNSLQDYIFIQFEGGPCRRTPRDLQIVVEDFVFFVALDELTGFLVRYFQHVLCPVDNKRASLHGNQVVVLSDHVPFRPKPIRTISGVFGIN